MLDAMESPFSLFFGLRTVATVASVDDEHLVMYASCILYTQSTVLELCFLAHNWRTLTSKKIMK